MPAIIVTGASRGLGKAIATKFAAGGFDLLLTAMHESTMQVTVKELRDTFPSIRIGWRCHDLSKKKNAQEFGKWCLEQAKPDILVNNAGNFAGGNVSDEEEGALEQMIETNLYSAYHLTRTILPDMILNRHGHIFNMCSIAGLKAYRAGGAYSISKFALNGFSMNLREECKPQGVKVTTVFPGAAYTDSWAASGMPRSRFMESADIADMIYAASTLSPSAVVEEIVLRPQLGDIE